MPFSTLCLAADCPSLFKDFATFLGALAALVGAVGALFAIKNYGRNSRLERARWLESLYTKFYEEKELKEVRRHLDCETGTSPEIENMVDQESEGLTDYLNFFEFVALLWKSGQLQQDEIEDLFGYYLDCLDKSRKVRAYIALPAKGYEQLEKLLRSRSKAK